MLNWKNYGVANYIENLPVGTYEVDITDKFGCLYTRTTTLGLLHDRMFERAFYFVFCAVDKLIILV